MPVEMYESRKESARPEDSEQISGGSVQDIILNPVNAACRRRQSDCSEAEVLSVGFFILPDLRVPCRSDSGKDIVLPDFFAGHIHILHGFRTQYENNLKRIIRQLYRLFALLCSIMKAIRCDSSFRFLM